MSAEVVEESSEADFLESYNVAFMGCNVVEGEGIGIVIATGAENQV
jgi:magnesium-transporting ATPase (P-type)